MFLLLLRVFLKKKTKNIQMLQRKDNRAMLFRNGDMDAMNPLTGTTITTGENYFLKNKKLFKILGNCTKEIH